MFQKKKYTPTLYLLIFLSFLYAPYRVLGQANVEISETLLDSQEIQLQIGNAINAMYNFKFSQAELAFQQLKSQYPEHPLPYFLLGLSVWWQMMPNIDQIVLDTEMLLHIDQSIALAEKLYQQNSNNGEAVFFLAAGYGMRARLYAYRNKYGKAAGEAKTSLKYFKESQELQQLNPEFLFGEGLYNFYSIWIWENYPLVRPLMAFMKKGDKELGLTQLKQTAYNAFYTRTEAQFFLMEIYQSQEEDLEAAYGVAYYLHQTFPDNPYFHRTYAQILFSRGLFDELLLVAQNILTKVEAKAEGYEAMTGRYATHFLGYTFYHRFHNLEKAKEYFEQNIVYSEQVNAYEYGYYHSSLAHLARIADKEGRTTVAQLYYSKILEYAERKSEFHDEAKEYLKQKRKF